MKLEQISKVEELVYHAQQALRALSGDVKATITISTLGGGLCYDGCSYSKQRTDEALRRRIEMEMDKLEKAINEVFYR